MPDTLTIAVAVCATLGLIFAIAAAVALRRRRYFRMLVRALIGLVWLALAALIGLLGFAVQGYRTLTHEEVAATVRTEPTGPKQFKAHFRFADGRTASFDLAVDELYVDAHILKWKPLVNILGLHTAYELDRVGGRYLSLTDERAAPRTLHPLAPDKPVDLFDLRRRYVLLSPLVDAEYGSGTFILADEPAEFEVRVSASGLLVRRKGDN